MPEPAADVCCHTCRKLLLATILRDVPLICSDPEPTQCYECEMKDLARKVAEELMREDEGGYGFDGPG